MREAIVKVGQRGQVVIPAEMRREEGLDPGSYVRIVDVDGVLVMRKVKPHSMDELIEALQESGLAELEWEEVRRWRDEEG